MHLIQLLLPVQDGRGRAFPRAHCDALAQELTERFDQEGLVVRAQPMRRL